MTGGNNENRVRVMGSSYHPCWALASIILIHQCSTATGNSLGGSWSAPLRIGVRTATNSNPFLSRRRQRRWLAHNENPMAQQQQESLASIDNGDNEWSMLFPEEDDGRYTAAARATRTMNSEPTLGFRRKLQLPTFLLAGRDDNDHQEDDVVPCAAVAVSSKVSGSQASFSPALQTRQQQHQKQQDSARRSNKQRSEQQSASSATATATTMEEPRPLQFWENMICGAISRSVAQTVMHPANTMKTLLQKPDAAPLTFYLRPSQFPSLLRGAGANFVLSVPHGAINFAVLEMVRKELGRAVRASQWADREERLGPALDFMSSAISTVCCSIVSTPQMMITDNIMAGNYKNLPDAVRGIGQQGGIKEFYARGWLPGLVGKIPSYALTWTLFQQLKLVQRKVTGREATNMENSIMGCLASGTTVTIMIPMDTIKTRLVTQSLGSGVVPYKGIVDCAVRVAREEGMMAFYKGLPPRLISVVPMIGIQFTVYEFMKKVMQKRAINNKASTQQTAAALPPMEKTKRRKRNNKKEEDDFDSYSSLEQLQESCMEVAASPEHPYPAPHLHRVMKKDKGDRRRSQRARQQQSS